MPHLTIQQAFELAIAHHQAGRLHDAEQLYRQILIARPRHAEAMHYLGVIAHRTGHLADAVNLMRHAIALRPDCPHACSNLGDALRDMGRLDESIAACELAIKLDPNLAEAHNNLGNALRDQLQPGPAIAAYQRAVALRPDFSQAFSNLGLVMMDAGKFAGAVAAFEHAMTGTPGVPQTVQNLGKAFYGLGNSLNDAGQIDDAIAAYERALALNPANCDARNDLALALKETGQLDESIAAYRRAIEMDPGYVKARSGLICAMQYHPACDDRAIADELAGWNRRHAEPLQKFSAPHLNDPAADRRLRIGYVSPDFRDHVIGRNLLPLFRRHDHRQFQIICYSQVLRPDAMTQEFQSHCDLWRNMVDLSDEQAAGQIRDDKIDVLVDLTLHLANNRLLVFARKPAPVQVTFAGYPGSTGLSTVDYRLSDPCLDPPGMDESVYREQTIRLPNSFWCYDPLENRDVQVGPLPAMQSGVITFASLGNFCKVNEEILQLWAQLLEQVKDSRLMLLAAPGRHQLRTGDRLAEHGIDPARLEFVPRQSRRAYLETYNRIDIGLDSFPYNGHTTSLDSFWMGVPVVTLVGRRAVSRAGWCQLSNLGLSELAAHTPGQFVDIAVQLAGDRPRLGEMRSTLRQRMERSPLMDAKKFALDIESAYRQMWRRWSESKAIEKNA